MVYCSRKRVTCGRVYVLSEQSAVKRHTPLCQYTHIVHVHRLLLEGCTTTITSTASWGGGGQGSWEPCQLSMNLFRHISKLSEYVVKNQ